MINLKSAYQVRYLEFRSFYCNFRKNTTENSCNMGTINNEWCLHLSISIKPAYSVRYLEFRIFYLNFRKNVTEISCNMYIIDNEWYSHFSIIFNPAYSFRYLEFRIFYLEFRIFISISERTPLKFHAKFHQSWMIFVFFDIFRVGLFGSISRVSNFLSEFQIERNWNFVQYEYHW